MTRGAIEVAVWSPSSYSPETVLSWRCCGMTSYTSSSSLAGSSGGAAAPPLLPPAPPNPPAAPTPPPEGSSLSLSSLLRRSPPVNYPLVSCSKMVAAASSSGVA
ncbi:unnamed protein product [Closterium sp. NIES-54]